MVAIVLPRVLQPKIVINHEHFASSFLRKGDARNGTVVKCASAPGISRNHLAGREMGLHLSSGTVGNRLKRTTQKKEKHRPKKFSIFKECVLEAFGPRKTSSSPPDIFIQAKRIDSSRLCIICTKRTATRT